MRNIDKEWQYYIQQACDAERDMYNNATKMVTVTLAVGIIIVIGLLAAVLWWM